MSSKQAELLIVINTLSADEFTLKRIDKKVFHNVYVQLEKKKKKKNYLK